MANRQEGSKKLKDEPDIDLSLPPLGTDEASKLIAQGASPFEQEKHALECDRGRIENLSLWVAVPLKIIIATIVISIMIWWLKFVKFTVLNQGWTNYGFHISDSVLITLLTTTTANILFLMNFIVKHYFPTTSETRSLSQLLNWAKKK